MFVSCNSFADKKAQVFAGDVLLHVVLHEIGHALIREFDLPVLGNEETMADSFATHFLIENLPERASDVLTARVKSLILESKELPETEWSVAGEHNSDARRANQITALAIAAGYDKYQHLADVVGMEEKYMDRARDYGTEIHRSWRRILRPLTMPSGRASREIRIRVSDLVRQLDHETLINELKVALEFFDWHSQISLVFEEGDGSAYFKRNGRTIVVKNAYINRFILQASKVQ